MKTLITVLVIFAALSVFTIFNSKAAEPDWPAQSYGYIANNEPVGNILKLFAANYGLKVIVSEKLVLRVSGQFHHQAPQMFLKTLAAVTDFYWYYDGVTLYFYHTDELQHHTLQLGNMSSSELHDILIKLPWWDGNATWTELARGNLVYVSGAPRFVDLVRETSALMDQGKVDSDYVIKIYRLTYASAQDRSVAFRGETEEILGVASLLRNAMVQEQQDFDFSAFEPDSTRERRRSSQSVTAAEETTNEESDAANRAFIEADTRTNSVIIGDLASRMPMYEEVIRQLDVPVRQVEINVTIVNISTDNLSQTGVSWESSGDDGAIRFGEITAPDNETGPGELSLVSGDWMNFTKILEGDSSYFLARINFLAGLGKAKITSQPSLVTTDNTEGILDNSSTFYVRLTGERAVELFPVTVGTTLRVTPRIIQRPQGDLVQLDLQLQDGQQSSQQVDSIPVINETSITTQATIKENQGLIVGGYYYDSDSENEDKVPLVSELPIVGHLFKNTVRNKVNSVRLFLITPRIVRDDMMNSDTDEWHLNHHQNHQQFR